MTIFFLQGEGPADDSGEGEGGGEGETSGERGGQSGGGTTAANPAVISLLLSLKGQCHEMNNFFEGLENQINTFCIGADGFYNFWSSLVR